MCTSQPATQVLLPWQIHQTLVPQQRHARPPVRGYIFALRGPPPSRRHYGSDASGNSQDQQQQNSPPRPKRTLRQAWHSTRIRWYPIPILLGACVLVGVQARRQYLAERDGKGLGSGGKIVDENGQVVKMDGPWTVYVFAALPLNSISRLWGWANNLTLPMWFRPYGFKFYSYLFGCNLDEMKDPDLTHYASLGEFFYRELKDSARPISAHAELVSPADGKVLHFGSVKQRRVEQVKGITYSLDALLGLSSDPHSLEPYEQSALLGSVSKRERNFQIKDEKNFARVNGIDYSLDRLLGGGPRQQHWRVFSATWWSRWISDSVDAVTMRSGGRKGSKDKPLSCLALFSQKRESQISEETSLLRNEDSVAEEAGIPTPDTPEVLGRYADVALDVGSNAVPPILEPHSPGHDGVKEGNKLFFTVVYLAPGDYHHFHSPASWIVERRRHFRGELYSVSPYMAQRLANLFVLNERVALLGRWRHGFFSMIPVGATNVGSIRINFDRALRTNLRDQRALAGTYSEATYSSASRILGGQPLKIGDEMGGFLLGSTVVLVFEAPETFDFSIQAGQKIKMGQSLGSIPIQQPKQRPIFGWWHGQY
ncbi:phosphatidylserine decarboxylase [Tilletiaria anomala UBC 951]|uniref:Phosphatidylserine decarboxylase proenzyme 1, mitochondrial n=1 Tax=Tilletiaria anomala (strain ATCC 24038 / CBS 436.72 / UBC 951) TaxID=1037660 RepID=A0A066VUU1_TILAU|nr:phosphatidylserine decarboxylase [Tilletiaria anomala UBC 951]KDN42305.1 phosphatidylserine decarboxylase [Tilletiaria anomala UBC 951]